MMKNIILLVCGTLLVAGCGEPITIQISNDTAGNGGTIIVAEDDDCGCPRPCGGCDCGCYVVEDYYCDDYYYDPYWYDGYVYYDEVYVDGYYYDDYYDDDYYDDGYYD